MSESERDALTYRIVARLYRPDSAARVSNQLTDLLQCGDAYGTAVWTVLMSPGIAAVIPPSR